MAKQNNTGLIIGIVVIAGLAYAMSKGGLGGIFGARTATPATEKASKQTSLQPQLLVGKAPANVRQWQLGSTTYAKLTTPIDVGSGFMQWGVTADGYPVVSRLPPESYALEEWY